MAGLRHVAVIMDGNRRWAQRRGQPTIEGHRAGMRALERAVAEARGIDLSYLTVCAFSSETWKRGLSEISDLHTVFPEGIESYTEHLAQGRVYMRFIGDTVRLPASLRDAMARAEVRTRPGHLMTLNVALGYGARGDRARGPRAGGEGH
jgi:undecaprenyl diphosphate synthase